MSEQISAQPVMEEHPQQLRLLLAFLRWSWKFDQT